MRKLYGCLNAREAANLGFLPAIVLLDGVPMNHVAVVNDIEGWIDVYDTDEKGNIRCSEQGPTYHRLHGEVHYIPNAQIVKKPY